MKSRFIFRVRLLFAFCVVFALVLGVRLYLIQIVDSEKYREAAEHQYVVGAPKNDERGDILFTDKDKRLVTAATQQTGWRLAIQPSEIAKDKDIDADSLYASLSSVVSIDEERYYKSVAKTDDPYEDIAFRLSDDDADAIRALDLDGIVIAREKWRFYPASERAAHVLGFVGFQGDQRVGRYGLERYWEDTLAQDGNSLYINFFAEVFSNVRALVSSDSSSVSGDLITSIEPTVQSNLEKELDALSKDWSPKSIGGIVMDPNTGEIIALASWPTFNPNTFNTVSDASVFVNPMVESVYEMGSIIKPLTMAAGLDAGAVTPTTHYQDDGFIMRSGERISNYDGRARGYVSMQEVLNQSLNTGAAFVAEKMGSESFVRYMKSFELGMETGIDLPNEVKGIMTGLESGADVDIASASFGQGIAMSPIETVRALASLANGGQLVQPHIVKEVRLSPGVTKKLWDEPEKRVLSKEATEDVTRMLVTVVDEALKGGTVKLDRYSIAAKTGTAQIASPYGGYYDDRYLHSFFGYFPAHDAKFIVFLFIVEPQGVRYASETLTDPFMEITQFLINYYNIPPDR